MEVSELLYEEDSASTCEESDINFSVFCLKQREANLEKVGLNSLPEKSEEER